ncbi:SPE2 [Candida pseudojiufengensis]|uniref:SPE2 n=1 Tax=Candida pseudojiufengensis TaxID=497109 RepID=UPI0022240250|nr:SPE2 [Candida pseudojiufengensis]KAI5964149.1 SPE2 [Candida pseudojiufengensis]
MVAPAYHQDTFVDHELSTNLDSSYAFEGPEKLLEIWFWKSENDLPKNFNEGLRSIELKNWIKILDLVNCKILSMKSSKFMDAYLLSESSLFIFPHKLILKTCGTTTTLACLDELFQTISKALNFVMSSKEIYKIFYSRRSFMFPEKQIHVHKDWKNEVSLLNEYFICGKSYIVGNFASDDHWYLYFGGKEQDNHSNCKHHQLSLDQTFEILMTELNPNCANKFIYSRKPGEQSEDGNSDLGHELGMETMIETELNCIFEPINLNTHLPSPSLSESSEEESDIEIEEKNYKTNNNNNTSSAITTTTANTDFEFIHDAFAFTPCGYSSNSICSNINGGYYYTLHITPESGWSYASFETNFPFNDSISINTVLKRILKIFDPKKFSMTLINEKNKFKLKNSAISSINNDINDDDEIFNLLGYEKNEKISYDLKNEYDLLYMNFEKKNNQI